MKLLLQYLTVLGPRVIVAEVSDVITGRAVLNAHISAGFHGHLVEEMPRISLRDHMAKHKRAAAKSKIKIVSALPANVTPIKGRKP